MSLTYTDEPRPYGPAATDVHQPFTPVYARTGKSRSKAGKGGVKTWMILAPIGVLGLGVLGAMALSGGGDATEPLVAEAPLETALPTPAPLVAEPMMEAPLAATPAPVAAPVAPAPVARQAAPVRRSAPTPRAAATVEAPAPAIRVETPVEPTGPRPYTPTATATPPAAPAAPLIVIEPVAD